METITALQRSVNSQIRYKNGDVPISHTLHLELVLPVASAYFLVMEMPSQSSRNWDLPPGICELLISNDYIRRHTYKLG